MFKNVEKFFKSGIKRTVSVALAVLVSLPVITYISVNGEKPSVKLPMTYYPLVDSVTEKGSFVKDFYKNSDWEFQGRDFGANASAFENECENFTKPTVITADDGKNAFIKWNAVNNADHYRVSVLCGNSFIASSPAITTGTSLDVSGLNAGKEHFVQVCAFKDGDLISSSQIGGFFAYAKTENERILVKGDSASGTGNFKGVKTLDNGKKVLYYTGNDSYRNFIFGSGNTLTFDSDIKAFAFRFEQSSLNGDNNKWIAPSFKPLIDKSDNSSYSGKNITVYYVSDDGAVYESSNNGNTRFNNFSFPQFKSGWIIIPSTMFKSSYFTDETKHRFILTVESLYEITYNNTENTYTKSNNQVKFSDHELYFSDFIAVSDINLFLNSLAYTESEADKGVSAVYGHEVQSSDGFTLTNENRKTKYTFGYSDNGKTRTALSYTLVSKGEHRYGMSLGFTASEDGIYDFSNLIKTENCKKNATVYYRVVKEKSDGSLSAVWPADGDWYSVDCNTSNRYAAEIMPDCLEVDMQKGEKLRMEAYAEFENFDEGSLDIRILDATLVKVNSTVSGSNTVTEYEAAAYSDCFSNSTAHTQGYYGKGKARFNISAFKTDDTETDLSFTSYSGNDGYFTEYKESGIGYSVDMSGSTPTITASTSSEYGVAFTFTSPKTGTATLSFENPEQSRGRFKIILNGRQVYPESGISEQNGTVIENLEVLVGDTVRLEYYTDTDAVAQTILGKISLILNEFENTANLPGTGYYSPLWVRPYGTKIYNGIYDQSGNVWSFDFVDKNSQTASGNMFASSDERIIYNSTLGCETAYVLKKDEITLKLSQIATGTKLGFTVPQSGYYDYGYVLSVISGKGETAYRLINGDTVIHSGVLTGSKSEIIKLNGEIFLKKDDVLCLEIIPQTLTTPLEISIGNPTVINGVTVTPNADGNIAKYSPTEFVRLESGYAGAVRLENMRFTYYVCLDNGIYVLDTADYRQRLLYNADVGGGIKFSGGTLTAFAPENGTLKTVFTPVRYGKTAVIAEPKADCNFGFTVKKVHNDVEEIIFVGSDKSEYNVNAECILKSGDTVVFEIVGSAEVDLGSVTVCTEGTYPTVNEPNSNVFTASLDYPYADEYIGPYNDRDGIWCFGILNCEDEKFVSESVNYYDSSDGMHLYSKEKLSGYRFKNSLLYADITATTGISLEFKAPYSGKFEFTSSLGIVNSAKADVYYRVIKNGKTVYPEKGEWKEYLSADKNTDIEIPLLYFDLQEGDRVSLQICADNISGAETAELLLNYPQFKLYSPLTVSGSDFTANVYKPTNTVPFAGLGYVSGYTLSNFPSVSGEWNFEFIDLLDEKGTVLNENPKEIKANSYTHYNTSDIIKYSNGFSIPNYTLTSNGMQLRVFTSLNKNDGKRVETAGESCRFVSPCDGEATLSGSPSLTKDLQSGQKVYFRILHNEETVYPENGGWEIFSDDKKVSDFTELKISLKKLDEIKYQFYTDADDEILATYDNKSCNNVISFNPSVSVFEWINESKTSFNFVNDMQGLTMQLNPFWKAQYTYDIDSPKWLNLETYNSNWNYWMSAGGENYIGISPTGAGEFWISNGSLKKAVNPAVAATYTANTGGYIQLNKVTVKMLLTGRFPEARFRITKNKETVWPEEGGWQIIDDETTVRLDELMLAVDVGDEIRFEVTSKEPLEKGEQFKIALNPRFGYSKYGNVYSKDKDIFGMLDKEMYNFFKEKDSLQFDNNNEINRKNSENFLKEQTNIENKWLAKLKKLFGDESEESGISANGNEINSVSGTEGYYIEGTPDTIIKRRKKLITYITGGMPTYAVVLIVVGSVAVISAGVVLLIIFIKRKKRGKAND